MELVEQFYDTESFYYFQHDGGTWHTSGVSMALITIFFEDHIIAKDLWFPTWPYHNSPSINLYTNAIYIHASVIKTNSEKSYFKGLSVCK